MHYQVSQIRVLLPRAMGMLHPEPLVGIGYRRLVGMRYSLGGYVGMLLPLGGYTTLLPLVGTHGNLRRLRGWTHGHVDTGRETSFPFSVVGDSL